MIDSHFMDVYQNNIPHLTEVKDKLVVEFKRLLNECNNIDQVSGRVKDVESFECKAQKSIDGALKYSYPLIEIQDQIGVRIVVFYKSDVDEIKNIVLKHYTQMEQKEFVPEDLSAFNYEGVHFILTIPDDCRGKLLSNEEFPEVFELQIHTLFQHAWAEANHNLLYKSSATLDSIQKRKIAFTAAQAWGADMIFEELTKEMSVKNSSNQIDSI